MTLKVKSRLMGFSSSGRTRFINVTTGAVIGTTVGATYPRISENQTGYVGPKPWVDNPFTQTKQEVIGSANVNGLLFTTPPFANSYENWSRPSLADARLITVYDSSSIPWTYLKTKALANLNPNRPSVDLPVFLFELRDFPRMLRDLGEVLSGRGRPDQYAGGYLAYSFGWAPLFGDLTKLMNLSKLISDRIRRLKKMKKGRASGSLGNTTLESSFLNGTVYLSFGTSPPLIGDQETSNVQEYWYSAKVSSMTPLPPDDLLYREEMWRALGLSNLHAATLWSALPWSWLIDFFLNIGDVLDANRQGIKYHVDSLCVMAKCRRETKIKFRAHPTLRASDVTHVATAKRRVVYGNPTPTLYIQPFWTGHMTAILASLATVSALRGSR